MDAPQEMPLHMRDIPDEERRFLLGGLLKRFLLDQQIRALVGKEEAVRKMMAEKRYHKKESALRIPDSVKHYAPYVGSGAALGGLSGYLSHPKDQEDPNKGRTKRTLTRALAGGAIGGLLGMPVGGSIAGKVKDEVPAPTAAELEKWYKQSALRKIALSLPSGMKPEHLTSLIGAGVGGLGGLVGARATEGENDGYLKRIGKRLGMGAVGALGGAAIGGAAPMAKAMYQQGGGMRAFKNPTLRGAVLDEAKTVPMEAAKGVPGWLKGMFINHKAAAEGPRAVMREPGATDMESGQEITPEEYVKMRTRMAPGGLIGGSLGSMLGATLARSPESVLPLAGGGAAIGAGSGALANYLLSQSKAKRDVSAFQEKFPGLIQKHLESMPEDQRPGPMPGPGEEVVYSAPREHLKRFGLPKMADLSLPLRKVLLAG